MNKLFASSLEYYLHDLIKQVDGQCDYGVDYDATDDSAEIKKLLLKISKRLNILYESDYSWTMDKAKSDEIDGALSRLCGQIYGWDGGGWSVNKLTGIEKALRIRLPEENLGEGQLIAVPYDPDAPKNQCDKNSLCYTCEYFRFHCFLNKRGRATKCRRYSSVDTPKHSVWD